MPATRPQHDITPDVEQINYWHFVPYTDSELFSAENPLYAVVTIYEEIGDVMIYCHPGEGGVFHSLDPSHTDADIYPPTNHFETAITKVVTNPNETHDLSDLTEDMHTWEHHFFGVIIEILNTHPSRLPPEVHYIIEMCVSSVLEIEIASLDEIQPDETDMFSV